MQRSVYHLLVFTLLYSLFPACQKQPKPPDIKSIATVDTAKYTWDTCVYIPQSKNPFGYDDSLRSWGGDMPCFNPLNNDEFVYEDIDSNGLIRLSTFNIVTRRKIYLTDHRIKNQPKWGAAGWIVFTDLYDQQLWKIKNDGSGLTQITHDDPSVSAHYFPALSPDGKKIIFRYGQDATHAYTRIIDLDGNVLQSDIPLGDPFNWLADGRYIAGGFQIYDTVRHIATTYPYYIETLFPDEKTWITTDTSGVYVFQSETNTLKMIKKQCGSASSNYFSISSDGKYILADRHINKRYGKNTLYHQGDIIKMKADGTDEHMINIK